MESYQKSYPGCALLNAKGDFNRDFDRDGVAVLRRRIELPVADSADSFVIQSDADIAFWLAVPLQSTSLTIETLIEEPLAMLG